jgi:lysozyme
MTVAVSLELIEFVAAWEGFKPLPAPDRLVRGVWDIGHGHVLTQADRDHPILGRFYDAGGFIDLKAAPLTRDEARDILTDDLLGYAEDVDAAIEPFVASQNEFDACVSLAYNVGSRAFRESTLARRLREGNPWAASDEFPRWHKAGGRPVIGLMKRRAAEQRIFLDADYGGRP